MILGNFFARAAGFLSIMYLARVFGPDTLGALNFVLAVVGYFTVLVTFGLDDFGILHVAADRSPANIENRLGTLLGLRITSSAFCFFLLALSIWFIPQFQKHNSLFLILGLNLFVAAFNLEWLYIAIEKMEVPAVARTVSRLVYLALLYLLVRSPEDLLMCGVIAVFSEALMPLILISAFSCLKSKFRISFNVFEWWYALRYNLPLSMSSIMGLVRMNADLIILGFLVDPQKVGFYAAILALVNSGILFCSLVRQVIYARIISSYNEKDKGQFANINIISIKYGTIIGVFIGFFGTFFAPQMIGVVFGEKFLPAAPAFQIAIWVVSLNFMGISLPHALMAHNRKGYFMANLLAGLFNIALNFLFMPFLGIMGAALSYFISTFFWIGLSYYLICIKSKLFDLNLLGMLLKPCLALIVCGGFVTLLRSINAYVIFTLSAMIYISILYLTRYLSINQIKCDFKAIRRD